MTLKTSLRAGFLLPALKTKPFALFAKF